MGPLLLRLGRASVRARRAVISLWLLVLAVVGVGAVVLSGPTDDNFSIPGTESFEALDRLGEAFPGADGATGQVVIAGPRPLDQQAAVITEAVGALGELPAVVAVEDPFATSAVSPDGRTALVTVQYDRPVGELDASTVDAAQRAVEPLRAAGLQVELGGEALTEAAEESHLGEVMGLAVAALVLAMTLGSLVAAGLPLATGLIGVGIGVGGVTALTGVVDLSSTAPVLALMLGLAVGIDYALFVLARYRQEVAAGLPREDAIARAVATAGSAVVFAGGTVVIALVGLAVVGIPFLTQMGLAAAATVTVAVLIAVTLLPALLAVAGPRVESLRVRPARAPRRDRISPWVRLITRRPVATLLASLVVLGGLALPVADLELGLSGPEVQSTDSSPRRAYDLISAGFGPGANGPLLVLAQGSAEEADEVLARVTELPGVVAAGPAVPSASGQEFLLSVVPSTAPTDPATADLVDRFRALDGAELLVTGQAAINIDVSDKLADALPLYIVVVVGLALLLLLLVFRSVLVPVKAVAGFLLTLAATGGGVVAVFQKGWLAGAFGVDTTGPIISFLPVLVVGIVFGLAMDYQVFLVSRMKERHAHGATAVDAVRRGFTDSAPVVAAAAVIMTAVFSGFVLSPDPVIKSIGFALALGVLLDAFVVRMTLVPAVLTLLGDRAWWLPRGLDRVLPDVDVEGAGVAPAPVREPVGVGPR